MCCYSDHYYKPHETEAKVDPIKEEDACICPGEQYGYCCGAKTGDDGYCDRCREWCNKIAESIETPFNRVFL